MISIVVAAYNEEEAVRETVEEIERICAGMGVPFEIVVVDDGSTDGTAAVLSSLKVTVVCHPYNVGYGHSLKDGIASAKYETIVITDADQTYPLDRIPDLYSRSLEGFDMVVGARTGRHYEGTFLKEALRKILKFLAEFTAGRKIPDINSGLRLFHRETAKAVFPQLCDGFSFTTSLTLAYLMTGKFVSYVPIAYGPRSGKTKVRLLKDSLRTLQYVLQLATYYQPLKIFFLFSGLCLVHAAFWFLIALFLGLHVGFFLGIGSMLVSLIVLCMGLLADLLKQILQKSQ
ncbi:MAG: glycosyltransferase family 2 protein [Holosporales bacterium]|jgi:glycosyltransferase involved in cell wall biosynthesis|nr:glycosyltransferase family 2 protein [Holosporales bacterium]